MKVSTVLHIMPIEGSPNASMAEMVVNGVATRKVSRITEMLCGTSYSKAAVLDICKDLDEKIRAFRERPLTGSDLFLTVDLRDISLHL